MAPTEAPDCQSEALRDSDDGHHRRILLLPDYYYPPGVSVILSLPLLNGQPRGFPPQSQLHALLISGDGSLSPPYLDLYISPSAATAVNS